MERRLEEMAGDLLVESGQTIAVAESCTGGLVGSLLTDVPGSSRYFLGGVIAYDDHLKTTLLGVPPALIVQHGAVSRECALQMARAVRDAAGADFGVALTGVAGPGGGTPEKPVGTVFISLVADDLEKVQRVNWNGTRSENKQHSAEAALGMLIDYLGQAAEAAKTRSSGSGPAHVG